MSDTSPTLPDTHTEEECYDTGPRTAPLLKQFDCPIGINAATDDIESSIQLLLSDQEVPCPQLRQSINAALQGLKRLDMTTLQQLCKSGGQTLLEFDKLNEEFELSSTQWRRCCVAGTSSGARSTEISGEDGLMIVIIIQNITHMFRIAALVRIVRQRDRQLDASKKDIVAHEITIEKLHTTNESIRQSCSQLHAQCSDLRRALEVQSSVLQEKDTIIADLRSHSNHVTEHVTTSFPRVAELQVCSEKYTDQECYLKAVEIDPTNSHAWYNLGASLTPMDTVMVGADEYTQRQCYLKAVDIDPTNSQAWHLLADTLGTHCVVVVAGVQYNKQECYLKGSNTQFDACSTNVDGDDEEPPPKNINNSDVESSIQLLLSDQEVPCPQLRQSINAALQGLKRLDMTTLHQLCKSGGQTLPEFDKLNEEFELSSTQWRSCCVVSAAEGGAHGSRLPNGSMVIKNIANMLRSAALLKMVAQRDRQLDVLEKKSQEHQMKLRELETENEQCKESVSTTNNHLHRALERNSSEMGRMNTIIDELRSRNNELTEQQNHIVARFPRVADLERSLDISREETRSLDREVYNLVRKLLHIETFCSNTFLALGRLLLLSTSATSEESVEVVEGEERTAQVGHHTFTAKKCFEKAMELNRDNDEARAALSRIIGQEQRVLTRTVERRREVVEHLEGHQDDAVAWLEAARILPQYLLDRERRQTTIIRASTNDEDGNVSILINGAYYTQEGLLTKALELDPTLVEGWRELGELLLRAYADDSSLITTTTDVTPMMCFVKALDINPNMASAWCSLSTTLLLPQSSQNNIDSYNNGNNTVTIQGVTYTQQSCLERAIEVDSTYKEAWRRLGRLLVSSGIGRVDIAGVGVFTAQQCIDRGGNNNNSSQQEQLITTANTTTPNITTIPTII